MPWTAYLFKHSALGQYLFKEIHLFLGWAMKRIQDRIADRQKTSKGKECVTGATPDFLDIFLDTARTDDPPGHDWALLMDWTLVNVMAGADTTSIGLRAVLYYILKSPRKKEKLLEEIRSAGLSNPVSWKQSQQLPYLDACIKEALRLHPAIGLGLERKVPPGAADA